MEAALLEKALAAIGTGVWQLSGVLLHVVEHRVLAGLRDPAVRAYELALLVSDIDSLRLDHSCQGGWARRTRLNFFDPAP